MDNILVHSAGHLNVGLAVELSLVESELMGQ